MKLSYQEIEALINQIVSGRKLVRVGGRDYYFRFPLREEKLNADFAYRQKLVELRSKNIPTEEEMLRMAHAKSIYTHEDERRFQKLQQRYSVLSQRAKQNPTFKGQLGRIKKEIRELNQKKHYITSRSANYLSERYKINYLFCLCTEDVYGEPIWDDVDLILDTLAYEDYKKLLNEFIKFLNGIPLEKIRAVARSNLWQTIYISTTSSGQPLFDLPASEWDINKVMLVYWSDVYRKAHERYDIPDHVWENDEAFDAFLARKAKEQKSVRN